ncbi:MULTISPECIES: MerR family transcriptional regulator [Streptomyces]|uniref:Mercuric resistance operon regulatory protein n=2 Tax=Streptomyces TaxID=1883 RepID=A0A1D8G3I9_9ACTN|nr:MULTISPECIES: MerR family transcriptional regulator [Streptomyces]AOT60011.1 Mercuric resistance operon regulatory protein [Streptomyces rubrolavendulae]KAF0651966.1 MerR family transcriptional regulator [Streptomyces fradiae ATCC 10745 = DSM 40063]OSY50715.1 Mercuric resistance operon regulatory protein [Streptomyces fradiae ATCC 10745 = DSM 40063]QEV13170.1 MerR family transcriptional regulator [Streptomyces fradiae ATCC 10745 = DSM 40063]UQS31570.1 MerR family transcriptional regulator [
MADDQRWHMRIGEVAQRTGLPLRTIRHYEDAGIAAPSARTKGGFRLYTAADVERLLAAGRMRPLGFTVDEMRDVLDLTDRLASVDDPPDDEERALLRARLDTYRRAVEARCEALRVRLRRAEDLAAALRGHLDPVG